MDERSSREMHLVDYWHVLRKRRWVIFTAIAVLFTTVTIGSFLITPQYRATAVIQIERDNPNIVNFKDIYSRDNNYLAYTDFYQTQYRLIESRDVLRRVVERLDLPNHPAMVSSLQPGPISRGLAWLSQLLPADAAVLEVEADPLQPWVTAAGSGLKVGPIKNTHLVELTYISRDAVLAADLANAVADEYIRFNSEVKNRTSGLANEKLDVEIEKLTVEIEAMDEQLLTLGEDSSIVELGNKKTLVLSTLEEVTRAATTARIQRARNQAAYESLRDAEPTHLDAVLNSILIKDLKGRLTDLERQYAEKEGVFKPDYPDMVSLRSQIDVVQNQLRLESRRIRDQVVGAAQTAYRTSRGEEERLSVLEDEQTARFRTLEKSLAVYETLKAALGGKKEMRAELVKRRDETGVLNRMDDIQAGNIWLVEAAQVPLRPFSPSKKLNMLMALLVGIILGVGLAFFFEHIDNSIKNSAELERHTGLPALGLIPTLKRRGHGKVVALDSRGQTVDVELITHQLPKGNHAEAYRDLRTTLLLSSPDQPPKRLLVTSAHPREGKTAVSLNVAISLTQNGKRVLLLDADLRKPRAHKVLGLSRSRGLSSFLAGNQPWNDLVQPTSIKGLSVLTSGPIPPNPAELLSSRNFGCLLEELQEMDVFDHVIIDTPPLLAVADAVIIAGQTDGVLLVVHGGETPRQSVVAGLEKLRATQARVLGAVLNNVDLAQQSAYRYRYRYGQYTEDEGEFLPGDDRLPARARGGVS